MQESNKLYNCQKEYEKVAEVQETKNGEIFQSSEFTEIVGYIKLQHKLILLIIK